MTCSRAEALFSACWEDDLSLAERESVEAHIEACAACRRAYDGFVRTAEAVQALPRLEAEPGFTQAVLARVGAIESGAKVRLGPPRRVAALFGTWQWGLRPALAAAALAVVVGVGAYAVWTQGWVSGSAKLAGGPSAPSSAPAGGVQDETRAGIAPGEMTAEAGLAERAPSPMGTAAGPRRVPSAPAAGRGALAAGPAASAEQVVPDSLFDHAFDLEFALDPVNLRRVAGQESLRPARPMPASEVGRKASITF